AAPLRVGKTQKQRPSRVPKYAAARRECYARKNRQETGARSIKSRLQPGSRQYASPSQKASGYAARGGVSYNLSFRAVLAPTPSILITMSELIRNVSDASFEAEVLQADGP